MTNRKSIFVPKSVTLNDLERRNGPLFCVISAKSVAFGTGDALHCLKVAEDKPKLSATEM